MRATLKATARAYGGMDVLATVLGVPVFTLFHAASRRPRPSWLLPRRRLPRP